MQPTINVIDCYHGNNVPLTAFADLRRGGVIGIIHKASQGLKYRDPVYAERRAAAAAAGMLWGAYHFLDNSDVKGQVENFIEASGITAAEPFLLACDYENSKAQPTLQQCYQFMSGVDTASPDGVACALYSGNLIRETLKPHPGGYQQNQMVAMEGFFQNHRLWLAEYGPKENIPWPWCDPIAKSSAQSDPLPAPGVFLWQYTEAGRVAPLPGYTDGNFFDGGMDELKARWLA